MAISYVGGKVQGFVGTTSVVNVSLTDLTGGSDTAPSAGDFVVVYYGTGSNSTARAITVNSSYTNLTKIAANDTYDTNLVVGYKRMGSTPDTSVQVSGTLDTADAGAVVVHVFRGVDETSPLDVTSITATGTDSVLCNPGAITPTTAGAWIIAGGAGAHIGGTEIYSSSDLTSFRTVGANDTYDVTVGAGLKTDWTSGPFDPAAFTWSDSSATSYSWAAYTIALRPAPDVVDVDVPVTGVASTGEVGTVTVTGSGLAPATGVASTGEVGTAAATGSALVQPTGAGSTGQVGTATAFAQIDITVPVTGVSSAGLPGSITATGTALVAPTGAQASGQVGTVIASITVTALATGVSSTGAVGSVTIPLDIIALATGVSSTGAVGSVTIPLDIIALATGVSAIGLVNGVVVWGPIIPGDTAWAPLDPAAADAWAALTPPGSQVWTGVEPSGIDNWTEVVPSSGSWTPIET